MNKIDLVYLKWSQSLLPCVRNKRNFYHPLRQFNVLNRDYKIFVNEYHCNHFVFCDKRSILNSNIFTEVDFWHKFTRVIWMIKIIVWKFTVELPRWMNVCQLPSTWAVEFLSLDRNSYAQVLGNWKTMTFIQSCGDRELLNNDFG